MDISPTHIELLRATFDTVKGIKASGGAYQNLVRFLDGLSPKSLKKLVNARIKFVSPLAKNRLKKNEMLNKPNYIRNKASVPQNNPDGEHEFYNPDVKEDWSDKYKRSIDCNNPKGFSQKAHCAGRKKQNEEIKMNIKELVKTAVKEVVAEDKLNMFLEKNVPTDPQKWSYYKSQAKKKFDVYPSAYANGWAAKQYKAAGGGWRKTKG